MQVIKSFLFFTADVVSYITNSYNINNPELSGLKPNVQLYGHIESADNANVDSPRHLLTPLWSGTANIRNTALGSLSSTGIFKLNYTDLSGNLASEQNLLNIYCNDTYEQNTYFTNKPA